MRFKVLIYLFLTFLFYSLVFFLIAGLKFTERYSVIMLVTGISMVVLFSQMRYLEISKKDSEKGDWLKASYLGVISRIIVTLLLILTTYFLLNELFFKASLYLTFLYLILSLVDIVIISIYSQKV